MKVDTIDIRKTIMFLMEEPCATIICAPFEIFADEIHWELFANLFFSIYRDCANISSKWDYTNTGPVNSTYAAAYNLYEEWILQQLARMTIDAWMEELILAMKLLPEAGLLNMDNLYWEKFDKGGVGIFDLESTNMLRTLTQFADHKRKRHKNGDVSKSPRAGEQHTS